MPRSSSATDNSSGSSPPSTFALIVPLVLSFFDYTLPFSPFRSAKHLLTTCYNSSYARFFHQFLESTIAPAFARRVLLNSSYSQILGGMSNIGELLGALTVFFLSDVVTTPVSP